MSDVEPAPSPTLPTISPLGDSAVVLQWDPVIDPQQHEQIVAFATTLAFDGLIEAAPSYASLAVYFDPTKTSDDVPALLLQRWRALVFTSGDVSHRTIRIPVCYDGPDLQALSASTGLSVPDIIRIHSGRTYRVYLLGFMPGFAYMGEVDQRISAARHATPRARVPAGSVGIAGRQTGIYPLESPGGWQLIGSTPTVLFDAKSAEPALLRAGDDVIFEVIP